MKSYLLFLGVFTVTTIPTWAEWKEVTYNFNPGEENQVVGPNRALSSERPAGGAWTASFDLRNHYANLSGQRIYVYSAEQVQFRTYNAASGHAGRSSALTFKLRLSEPVKAVSWKVPSLGKVTTAGTKLAARYSLDGKTWKDAFVFSAGTTRETTNVRLDIPKPIRVFYFGWYANVPDGQNGYWDAGDTGTFTLTPVNKTSLSVVGSELKTGGTGQISLQGPRFIPSLFFGTVTHVNNEGAFKLLEDLKVRTVILNFRWNALEFGRGDYAFSDKHNFGKGNFVIDSAELGVKRGFDQVPMLDMAPDWALGKNGTYPNDKSIKALEECAFQIATKYKGKIKYWMANNEPDMAVWKDRFVVFMKAFYKGIKRADPNNKVVLCGFAGVESQHLDAVYRLGGKDYFDILGSHPYTRPYAPETGFLSLIKANYEVMKKYGDNKPIWVTEMGWNGVEPAMLEYCRTRWTDHRAYSCTEEEQNRYLPRAFLLAATVPWVERFYFFHLHQEHPYNEAKEGADGYMGLFTPWINGQIRPKDAYFAVKTVVGVLKESNYVGSIDMGSRIWALMFEREDEATAAIWSLDDGLTLTLKDISMITGVTSMVGTPIQIIDNRLGVSGRPIYIKTSSANRKALAEQIRQAAVEGGKTFELALGLDMPKTRMTQPMIDVRITNVSNRDQKSPEIFFETSEPWKAETSKIQEPWILKAGEERIIPVAVKKSGSVQGGEVVIRAKAHYFFGMTFDRTERSIRYVTAGRVPGNFKADGNLDEWRDVTSIEIGKVPEQRNIPDWKGTEDLSGKWYVAWDEQAMYFAAEIKDDVHHQPANSVTATDIWRADSIQLGIDVGGDARPSSNVPQYDGVNDVEIGFGLGKDTPLSYFWVNPMLGPGPGDLTQFAVVRDQTSRVTRYETAIPWSKLGLKGSPQGKWMGINILVNDSDGKDRRGWLQWSPGIGEMKDPSWFPKVLFE